MRHIRSSGRGIAWARPMMARAWLASLGVVSMLALPACSGEEPEPDARAGDIRGSDVWKDGLLLTGTVTIAPGADVEIAPGATITCAEGAQILVGGTLRAKAKDAHAKITCETWLGILVAQGGVLDLEGVELENAVVGITATEGAGRASFADGMVTDSLRPFVVAQRAELEVARTKVTTPELVGEGQYSLSEIWGKLTASRLDYNARNHEGLMVRTGGELYLEDSRIHGKNGQDMVSSYEGKHVSIAYSELSGAHCGLHIEGVESFSVDHVTSENNTYGVTIYGSGEGPNEIKSSNISGVAAWLDLQGQNGPITIENVYASGGKEVVIGAPPTITNPAEAPIAGARPR
jgi:hypothetical protein